jgi:hypothetical protein
MISFKRKNTVINFEFSVDNSEYVVTYNDYLSSKWSVSSFIGDEPDLIDDESALGCTLIGLAKLKLEEII